MCKPISGRDTIRFSYKTYAIKALQLI